MNIAIFTPSQNPYSETFIQAHKNYLKGNIFYYYGSGENIQLENHGKIVSLNKLWFLKLKAKLLGKPNFTIRDSIILTSLKKKHIDVILVEYGTHAFDLLSMLRLTKLPFVVHFHGFDASRKSSIEYCNNFKDVFEIASRIIAVSRAMCDNLLRIGCPKDKLVYNVYGPTPEFEKILPLYNSNQFIGIGRFTNKKAPYYTILAFKKVLAKYSDAVLILAGKGYLMNVCINLVKHLKIESSVKFVGVISPETFGNYLKTSIAYVQHSIVAYDGDMEGTPLAVLEASVAGLPVISTYHAGIPDVIVHEKTGLLCEEHDVNAMAYNMLRVLDNKTYAKQLGEAGKKHISEMFNLKRHIETLQKVLNEAKR